MAAMLTLCVTIPKDLTSAHVKLDLKEMEKNALVMIKTFDIYFKTFFVTRVDIIISMI